MPWGEGRGKGDVGRLGGAMANGMAHAQTGEPPSAARTGAPKATRDVVTEATHANVAWRTWAGARGERTEASLHLTQEARDDRLLGVLFLTAHASISRLPPQTRGALLGSPTSTSRCRPRPPCRASNS